LFIDGTTNDSQSLNTYVQRDIVHSYRGFVDDLPSWTTLNVEAENTPKCHSAGCHVSEEPGMFLLAEYNGNQCDTTVNYA
jgi:hypothetical protein